METMQGYVSSISWIKMLAGDAILNSHDGANKRDSMLHSM
jgi:hypothetical protein